MCVGGGLHDYLRGQNQNLFSWLQMHLQASWSQSFWKKKSFPFSLWGTKQYGFLKLNFLWLLADRWGIKKGLLFVAAGCFVKWMVTIYHILYSCRIIGQVLVKSPFFIRRKKNFFYFSFRVGTSSTYVLPKYFELKDQVDNWHLIQNYKVVRLLGRSQGP